MNDSAPQASSEQEQQKPVELTGRQALLLEIADKLSQSRKASGESIEEAVRKLKLRKSHLQALENGNWDKMPDDIYALGFLRQYSQYLNVDLSDEIHRLKNDQYTLTKPLTFPDPPVAPSRRWAWVAGVAFVLLFILFNILPEKHITAQVEHIEPGQIPVEENTTDTITAPQSMDHSGTSAIIAQPAMSAATAETSAAPAAVEDTPIRATASADLTAIHNSEKTTPTKQMVTAITPAAKSGPDVASTQAQPVHSAMHYFRFDAVGSPVWLQISRPDQSGGGKGDLLREVLLQAGVHTTIHAPTTSLWITCGNAPALRISVDGSVFAEPGSLGAGKKVLRDYRFDIGGSE